MSHTVRTNTRPDERGAYKILQIIAGDRFTARFLSPAIFKVAKNKEAFIRKLVDDFERDCAA